MNYTYHRILPQNAKSSYTEFDVVDFNLSFPERSMVAGSLRLEGEVEVLVDNAITLNEDTATTIGINAKLLKIFLDGDAGAHSFCEQITTTIGGNVVESLGDYPRYVKMSAVAMSSPHDNNNSSNVCELKAPRSEITNNVLKGELTPTVVTLADGKAVRNNPDFSIKPRICLNGGRGFVPHRKSGDIQVSFNLARIYGALFGVDMSNAVSYNLKDLRVTFNSVPDDGSNEPITLSRKFNVKQSIQSSLSNINVSVPAPCSAVSCSFNVQSQENAPKYNNLALHAVPNLTSTQFLFNDSTNSLVSYQIRNNAELIDRYIDSFVDAEKNNMSPVKQANGNGFGLGLNFDEVIRLDQSRFSLELQSAVSNFSPLVIYLYFHSVIEL
jgi:hypothetical protein